MRTTTFGARVKAARYSDAHTIAVIRFHIEMIDVRPDR
jgi:hypothetical protein